MFTLNGKKSYIGAILMALCGVALAAYGGYSENANMLTTGVGMVPFSLLGAGLAHKLAKIFAALSDAAILVEDGPPVPPAPSVN